jgi:hypothetical protein
VNLAGFGKKTASGKTYPVLPDPDGEIGKLVAAIRGHVEDLDALTAALDLEKAELRSLASPFFFAAHHGKGEVASSVACRNGEQEILVAFQNRYKLASDDAQIIEVIGADRAAIFSNRALTSKSKARKFRRSSGGTARRIAGALCQTLRERSPHGHIGHRAEEEFPHRAAHRAALGRERRH